MIFYKDILSFLDFKKLDQFIPLYSQSKTERLNSILRFFIYASIILIAIYGNYNYILLPILIAMIIIIVNEVTEDTNKEQFDSELREPTYNKPFMNPTIKDYSTGIITEGQKYAIDTPEARALAKEVDDKFYAGFIRDPKDVYNRNGGRYQYNQFPITRVPDKRREALDYIYKEIIGPTCKMDRFSCYPPKNDLRYSGRTSANLRPFYTE